MATQQPTVINPYASQITFPAGTPPSIINAVLQMNMQNKAQGGLGAAPWWAQGFNSLIQNVLTPYVQQELITTPYQQAQAQFKSALDIQQAQQIAQNAAQIQQNFANQGLAQQAGAAYDYAQALNTPIPATVTQTQLGGGAQPDLLEPTATAPLPPSQVSPTTTGGSNIFTATPERKPTPLEAIAQIAGTGATGQLSAGQLIDLFKNPQVAAILDPLKAEQIRQALANQQQALDLRAQKLQIDEQAQATRAAAQASTQASQTGATQRAETQLGWKAEDRAKMDQAYRDLQSGAITPQEFNAAMASVSGRTLPQERRTDTLAMSQELNTLKLDPRYDGASEKDLRDIAQARISDRKAQEAGATSQARAVAGLNPSIARTEIPKIEEKRRLIDTLQGHLNQLEPALETVHRLGVLPTTPTAFNTWEAQIQRQYPSVWADPEARKAIGLLEQFYNGAVVTYDRAIIDVRGGGNTVKAAYSLPNDTTLMTYEKALAAIEMMRTGSQRLLNMMNQQEIQYRGGLGQNPSIPFGSSTPQATTPTSPSPGAGWIPIK